MKLISKKGLISVFIVILCILPTSNVQSGMLPDSNSITLNRNDAALETVLDDIEQQTDYTFDYDEQVLKNTKKVTVKLRNAPLKKALKECLKNQHLAYTITKKSVYLEPKENYGEWMLSPIGLWLLYYIDKYLEIIKAARKLTRRLRKRLKKVRKKKKKWLKKQLKKM